MTCDIINGSFELVGGVMTWFNVRRLLNDKKVRGVDWRIAGFWSSWSVWNILYYPLLNQPLSWLAGLVLAVGNLTWLGLAFHYRNR
jgi:hypothetical protein